MSLTDRCNLRCMYCMPDEAVDFAPNEQLLTVDELARISTVLIQLLGIRKVRISGGEPTVRRDFEEICDMLGSLRAEDPCQPGLQSLGITTNAVRLPRFIPALQRNGIREVNVSLDTLIPVKFQFIARRDAKNFHVVHNTICELADNPFFRLKVNCVVLKGVNDDEILDFAELTKLLPLDVRFIEFMPFSGNKWDEDKMVPKAVILQRLRAEYGDSLRPVRTDRASTAKMWQVDGFAGRVGIISSMTDEFCGGCNRVRLTADGSIMNCLFGTDEFPVRDALRSGAGTSDLIHIIQQAADAKHARLGGREDMHALNAAEALNRPMVRIGG